MKKNRYRTNFILSLLVAAGCLVAVFATGSSPKLGLDLEGGLSVILTAKGDVIREDVLNRTAGIIRQRIDQLGAAEPEVAVSSPNILIQMPGVSDTDEALELIGTTAQLTFRQVEEQLDTTGAKKKDKIPPITELKDSSINDEEVVYPDATNDKILYRLKPAVLEGDDLARAEAVTDPTSGAWSVTLEFNGEAADTWADFTGDLACLRDEGDPVKSQVAIVLDGKVESAAGMRSPAEAGPEGGVECDVGISGGQTQIDVGGRDEARDLALVLRTGALPITLEQSEVQEISPTLGRDSLNGGLLAGLLGLGAVMIYMLLYYRALGLVVWLGLAVFGALNYALIVLLGETAGLTLSLAGVAGFIISIGVTADSYIVAFERLKDEVRAGRSIRAAVQKGMERSFRTILVADFVTGSAAIILFYLAVGPVRGFALTLGLATIMDVVIAYFFTRSAVHLLARTKLMSSSSFFGMGRALGVERT